MIWALLLLAFALTLLGLVWAGRLPRATWSPAAAAMMLGLTGYVLQGQPGLAGAPVAVAEPVAAPGMEEVGDPLRSSNAMADRFGKGAMFQAAADGALRTGNAKSAAEIMAKGVAAFPKDVDMWVGYGNALIAHSGGLMTPAAALAFDQASRLDPAHPGPDFFAGMAMANSGDLAGAEASWSGLLERSPADAPWRADLTERLTMLRAMRSGNAPTIPASPPAP